MHLRRLPRLGFKQFVTLCIAYAIVFSLGNFGMYLRELEGWDVVSYANLTDYMPLDQPTQLLVTFYTEYVPGEVVSTSAIEGADSVAVRVKVSQHYYGPTMIVGSRFLTHDIKITLQEPLGTRRVTDGAGKVLTRRR